MYTVEPILKEHPMGHTMLRLKTGGLWRQVLLHWNVGPLYQEYLVFQDRWSLVKVLLYQQNRIYKFRSQHRGYSLQQSRFT